MKEEQLLTILISKYGRHDGKALHDLLLDYGKKGYPDKDYIDKLIKSNNPSEHQFISTIFEAQLNKYLYSNKTITIQDPNHTKKNTAGPDFKIQHKNCKKTIWIEAVAPNKGDFDLLLSSHFHTKFQCGHFLKVLRHPFGYICLIMYVDNIIEVISIWYAYVSMIIPTTEIPSNIFLSRYTNAIRKKKDIFKDYLEKEIVKKGDICIIAISSIGLDSYFGFDEPISDGSKRLSFAFQAVYGKLQEFIVGDNIVCKKFPKHNSSLIPADGFLTNDYKHISGILTADTTIHAGNKTRYILIHNVNATHRLPKGILNVNENLFVELKNNTLTIKGLNVNQINPINWLQLKRIIRKR